METNMTRSIITYDQKTDVAVPPIKKERIYRQSCQPLPELFRGPRIDTLRYVVHQNIDESSAALARGDVDLVDYPVTKPENFSGDIAIDECRDFGYYYISFNCSHGLTRFRTFRRALALLLDQVKKRVATEVTCDRLELMNSIMVEYYGRLVNPYLPSYETKGIAEAIAQAREALTDFRIHGDEMFDPNGDPVNPGSVRCLMITDEPTLNTVMHVFREVVESSPLFARIFQFETIGRNESAERVYRQDADDWNIFAGWQYVQDNLSRWNPGMSKLRLSLCWTADFQSDYSCTRNYPRFNNPTYDSYAHAFLTQTYPHDIRGAVITEEHLDDRWNNREFWQNGGDVRLDADALLLLWKIQWILADEVPIVPLFERSVKFARKSIIKGVFNGHPNEEFTVPGHGKTIQATYPGGTMSYWTFQRIRKNDEFGGEVVLGVSNRLRHLNPLGTGNYWDAVIWSRIYESMLGLNPFLLMKGVAEDAVNLAESFRAKLIPGDPIKEVIHFTVRSDVRWHDGEQFTAWDPVFTYLSVLGAQGREIANRHASTRCLIDDLVNELPIPSWIDYAKWIEAIEVHDDSSFTLYLDNASRFPHEWFGDMPIVPIHVWRYLGSDFTRPTYNGVTGLSRIVDHNRISPSDGFSGWNGLVGTGAFMWDDANGKTEDPLNTGGRLLAFSDYHNSLYDYLV